MVMQRGMIHEFFFNRFLCNISLSNADHQYEYDKIDKVNSTSSLKYLYKLVGSQVGMLYKYLYVEELLCFVMVTEKKPHWTLLVDFYWFSFKDISKVMKTEYSFTCLTR